MIFISLLFNREKKSREGTSQKQKETEQYEFQKEGKVVTTK